YYGGCEYADIVENLARDRAKTLFGAEHANVQPHAGSQANMAAYFAVLQPGDTILGLNLAHGGHLTHGHHLNFSGKTYKVIPYGVTRDTETIDYDELEQIALRERPKLIIGGGSAYARIIDFARMRKIADQVSALYLVDMAHFAETLTAAGLHNVSGGTDTHLMLVDVFSKGMLGSEAEKALGEAGITVNKNAIPFDTNPPLKPSGIRLGTPALTTRGMKEEQM